MRRPALLLGTVVLLSCAPQARRSRPAAEPAVSPVDTASSSPGIDSSEASQQSGEGAGVPACVNRQYAFECALPPGYVLTQERRGPGTVMILVKRALGSAEEANIAVRVAPLRSGSLEAFVEKRVARDLERAKGVAAVDKRASEVGGRAGVELLVDREYASGPYHSRIFCFAKAGQVFIIDHTVPSVRFEREKGALDFFVSRLRFADEPAP